MPHERPGDPPRRRALKLRGHGTLANDRPPIVGVVGRASGGLALAVAARSGAEDLEPLVAASARAGAEVHTDEWPGYAGLGALGFVHKTVRHRPPRPEWARDEDGDGVREVHSNTIEGAWTGVRNFLRVFRGVSKRYLEQYLAIFEWGYRLKAVTEEFLRTVLSHARTDLST